MIKAVVQRTTAFLSPAADRKARILL